MPLPEAPPTGRLPFDPPISRAPDTETFWQLWRQERFWACHEALEDVWREAPPPRRWFLGGLINGAVAVFQHRRGNAVGAARQLRRAQVKLERFRPSFEDLDVDAFLKAIEIEIQASSDQLNENQRAALDEVEQVVRHKISVSRSRDEIKDTD